MQVGFFGLLGLLFIALKLMGFVAWSWWFVLAPLWAPTAIVFGSIALVLVVAALAAVFSSRRRDVLRGRLPLNQYGF